MEDELAFTLNLAMYHTHTRGRPWGLHHLHDKLSGCFKSFKTFRGPLKPLLETVYAVNIIDLMMQVLPDHDPHDVPWFESFSYFESADLESEFMEQEAAKGKGAFVQALWTQYDIPKLYFLTYKAWRHHGAQNLTTWTRLAQAVLDGCFGQKWPDCVFQVPDACSICLSTMHWPEKTQCGHTFHLRCLLRHLDTVITGTIQRWASQRFSRVPSSSKGRRRVGIVQRMKQEWGKPETRRLKGKKRNGEWPSMPWKQTKPEMETGQACIGNRPSMHCRQAKYELATGQICNGDRPNRKQEAKEESEEEETVEEEEEACGCRDFQPVPRDMQGRRKDRVSEYVGFYDSLFENPEMWEERVEFQGGLGKDVWGMVQRYLREDLMWFHIMVKQDMFDTFRKEMEKIRDQFVLLPFWCLCDGLVNEKGKIQHRHMILACEPESSFEDVWKGKIRYEFPNSGRATKCKMKSAFHLVRTIMYVSQPKSSCDKDEIPDNLRNQEQRSHFHINRPLHPHSIAFLCTLFPGGIEKLLWEQVGSKNVAKWEKKTRRRTDAWGHFKWSVPIHVTGWKFLNSVIPHRYEETEESTPLYLNLYGNKKLYLKEGNNGGNCSFQRIRDEQYVLSRKQQNIMNEIKNVKQEWAMDQKVILKAKLNEMKAKNDLIQKEKDILKEKNDQIQKEKDILKEKNDLIQMEKDILKEKNDLIQREKDILKQENDVLKTKENELNSKVQGMSREIKILKRVCLQGKEWTESLPIHGVGTVE
ncbi:uncharacterized protein TNCV_3427211 [Trichonephila clavipes]|nr:uncharacterized protein TNCV_3427211 [Trichonephila clavipes]